MDWWKIGRCGKPESYQSKNISSKNTDVYTNTTTQGYSIANISAYKFQFIPQIFVAFSFESTHIISCHFFCGHILSLQNFQHKIMPPQIVQFMDHISHLFQLHRYRKMFDDFVAPISIKILGKYITFYFYCATQLYILCFPR